METEPSATEKLFTWADLEKLDMLHEDHLTAAASNQCDCQYSSSDPPGGFLEMTLVPIENVSLVFSLLVMDLANIYIL